MPLMALLLALLTDAVTEPSSAVSSSRPRLPLRSRLYASSSCGLRAAQVLSSRYAFGHTCCVRIKCCDVGQAKQPKLAGV